MKFKLKKTDLMVIFLFFLLLILNENNVTYPLEYFTKLLDKLLGGSKILGIIGFFLFQFIVLFTFLVGLIVEFSIIKIFIVIICFIYLYKRVVILIKDAEIRKKQRINQEIWDANRSKETLKQEKLEELIKQEIKAVESEKIDFSQIQYNYNNHFLDLDEQSHFFINERNAIERIENLSKNNYSTLLERLKKTCENINIFMNYHNVILHNEEKEFANYLLDLKQNIKTFSDEYIKTGEYIKQGLISTEIGLQGEKKVNDELMLYRDIIKNLGSIRLEVEETTVENDHIILSEKGIFCIETKNIGANSNGHTLKISKDGAIKRFNSKGEQVDSSNFIEQIYRHIGITQRFINNELKKINGNNFQYIFFNPIIVIANDAIMIENESTVPIIRTSSLYHYISTFDSNINLDKTVLAHIEKILIDNNKGSKSYPVIKYTDKILENYLIIEAQLKPFEKVYNKHINISSNLKKI